jgi:peptide/nickel transport system substrate-binding protein
MVTSKKKMAVRCGVVFTAVAVALPLLTFVGTGTASAAKVAEQTSFPRNETVYTSGTAYSPPTNFNFNDPGALYTGTQGLLYESLFLYDPIHNKYIPWLATSGSWSGDTYTMQIRNGVDWVQSPSQAVTGTLTGADVAFSINMERNDAAAAYHANVASVASVTSSGQTVAVHFTSAPAYTEWQDYLWQGSIVPASIWGTWSAANQVTGANMTPVSSGPMTLDTTSSTEACFQTNPHWWGAQIGLSFKFKYLCDSVNGSNNVELAALTTDQIDWSNNFLPGISTLIAGLNGTGAYGITSYYPKAPFMLSANTAWLELNTTKAPMSNVNFRKAVAYGINPQGVASGVYTGIVKQANPVGLLPNLDSFLNPKVVSQYGFNYNPTLAKKYLAASGYKGQTVTLEVPDGWTDWMAAIQNISSQLNAIGIKVTPIFPQDSARNADLTDGTYDMAIDNNATPDSTPWSYFERVYNLPILKQQNAQLNWERYTDNKAWALVQEAATVPVSNTAKLDSIYSQLESRFLQDLPEIPLWYNGAWFQAQSTVWKNYPSSVNPSDQYTPVLWHGWIGNMTTVLALAQLVPAS